MKDGVVLVCSLWDKVDSPKGVVQISHGMSEHSLRYKEFAEFLNAKDYIVFADDHRAHGKTEDDKNRGRHKGNIYKKTVSDAVEIYNYLKQSYNLPIYFAGHSYGSFIGQGFLQQSTDVRAVALLGTAYYNKAISLAGFIVLIPINLIFNKYRPSFVNKGSDLLFNHRYKGDRGKSQWLTRDKVKRQEFIDDPLCGIDMSINFDHSMIKGLYNLSKKNNLHKLNKNTPIALFCGTDDPIGGYGKKATALKKLYKNLGVKRVELTLYEGARHEVLNELDRQKTFNDILDFFESVD